MIGSALNVLTSTVQMDGWMGEGMDGYQTSRGRISLTRDQISFQLLCELHGVCGDVRNEVLRWMKSGEALMSQAAIL